MFCNTFSKDFQTFIEAGLLHYIACCITFCYATSQPYILHDMLYSMLYNTFLPDLQTFIEAGLPRSIACYITPSW